MEDATWTFADRQFGGRQERHVRQGGGLPRTTAMRLLGAVVYAARLADGTIKIGWTERFDLRLHWLKHYVQQDVELLAFQCGTYADEQAIHDSLAESRAEPLGHEQAREYYYPTAEVLAVVNGMRGALNMPPLAA